MTEPNQSIPEKMSELPVSVRVFLTELRPEEVDTLKHGIRLIRAIMTVGRATRWLMLFFLGILAGLVLMGETISKIWSWFQRPP